MKEKFMQMSNPKQVPPNMVDSIKKGIETKKMIIDHVVNGKIKELPAKGVIIT